MLCCIHDGLRLSFATRRGVERDRRRGGEAKIGEGRLFHSSAREFAALSERRADVRRLSIAASLRPWCWVEEDKMCHGLKTGSVAKLGGDGG